MSSESKLAKDWPSWQSINHADSLKESRQSCIRELKKDGIGFANRDVVLSTQTRLSKDVSRFG